MAESLAVGGPTVRELLTQATSLLAGSEVDTPRLDAELLLGEVLSLAREQLVVQHSEVVDPAAVAQFEALLRRRADREPVAYILGRKAFRWIELAVDHRVLIPRPETELLVEVGLGVAPAGCVVDVGTGSGAVALALKQERPDLRVVATDASPDALAVARGNADRLGLEVEFVQADLLDGVSGVFDAVLANLPYVPEQVPLQPEIARFEPSGALFAGPDGLDVIRRLVPMLEAVPLVALEFGFGQEVGIAVLMSEAGFGTVERLRDLAGHERVLVARR